MSFQVSGQILNIYQRDDFVDRSTGEVTKGKHYIQILVQVPLENGETRFEQFEIGTKSPKKYEEFKGKKHILPITIGLWRNGDRAGIYYNTVD